MPTTHTYDLAVYGANPGGLACAIRAARDGRSVLLVTHAPHLGGMLSSGICVWDTVSERRRTPIYDELREAMMEHYRATYGEESEQYRAALPGPSGHSNGNFEPRVAQLVCERMVAAEARITVIREHYPVSARIDGRMVCSVTFKQMHGDKTFEAGAAVFADCSYEGDLMKIAGAPYRFGRESREEFNEPHAGKIFMRWSQAPLDAESLRLAKLQSTLNLRPFPGHYEVLQAEGSGQGDDRVQAFNWRTALTDDPQNRIPIPAPAADPIIDVSKLERPWFGEWLPNRKFRINRPQLIGPQNAYVEGDWPARRRVMDEHWNAFLALVRFLQSDPSVPAETRQRWSEFGLANDEFADNGYRPYEIYARETRRLKGRHVFSEHDASLAPGLDRAPVHADSIAATEWYIDIHACTDQRRGDSLHEGKTILHQKTFPGHVPLRAILPPALDNLLVPVCVSSTHVGWGTIRLEPTWMNIGEAAGLLASMAVRDNVAPARVNVDRLQRALAKSGAMLSYFSDVDVSGAAGCEAAINYFGVKGFFSDYAARPTEKLSKATGAAWVRAAQSMLDGTLDAMAVVTAVHAAAGHGHLITRDEWRRALPAELSGNIPKGHEPVGRGEACRWLFEALEKNG